MRILFINPPGDIHRNIGGIETYAREVSASIAARGHTTQSLDLDPRTQLMQSDWRDLLPDPALRHRYYLWRTGYVDDYRYHQAVMRITRKAIDRFRPDLLHTFHSYHYGALLGHEVPAVVTCHGLEIEDIPPVRGSLERARGIHCNSRFTLERVRRILEPGPRPRVLTWGIRPWSGEDPAVTGKRYDLVTVGRLVRRKNLDTVLHALALRPGLRYAIAGEGPEEAALRRLSEQLGLRHVDFLGRVSESQRRSLLASSRLFVMCPRQDDTADVEGLGLVYYEAQEAGLPVIASRAGGVPEAVGDAGLLVNNARDPEELARAVEQALQPDMYAHLVEIVRQRQKEHSWDRFIDSWEEWYEKLTLPPRGAAV